MENPIFVNMESEAHTWALDKIKSIVDLLSDYAESHGLKDVVLVSVEDSTWSDSANQRYDIYVEYPSESGQPVQQKLLILKGEVIDGRTLHERFEEFYPETR